MRNSPRPSESLSEVAVDAGLAVSGPVELSERLNAEMRPSVSVVEACCVGVTSNGIESSAMPARTPSVRLIPN